MQEGGGAVGEEPSQWSKGQQIKQVGTQHIQCRGGCYRSNVCVHIDTIGRIESSSEAKVEERESNADGHVWSHTSCGDW